MRCRQTMLLVATLAVLTILPPAKAESLHSWGRHLGVGWSDGYHSRTACPPKRGGVCFPAVQSAPVNGPVPWWKIPSPEGERLPAPAIDKSAVDKPDGGASLFRQPGEGSSVTVR